MDDFLGINEDLVWECGRSVAALVCRAIIPWLFLEPRDDLGMGRCVIM